MKKLLKNILDYIKIDFLSIINIDIIKKYYY